jgi:hypothetical protein
VRKIWRNNRKAYEAERQKRVCPECKVEFGGIPARKAHQKSCRASLRDPMEILAEILRDRSRRS